MAKKKQLDRTNWVLVKIVAEVAKEEVLRQKQRQDKCRSCRSSPDFYEGWCKDCRNRWKGD